jgi:hypothetical protein
MPVVAVVEAPQELLVQVAQVVAAQAQLVQAPTELPELSTLAAAAAQRGKGQVQAGMAVPAS